LILMDCEMPVMNGFDATKRVRNIEKATQGLRDTDPPRLRVPVVALTAHALLEVRERCLEAGMDDFLVKPYDEQQMIDMLGRWLAPREVSPTRGETVAAVPVPPAANFAEITLDMVAIGKIRASAAKRGTSLLEDIVAQFAEISPPLIATMRDKTREGDLQGVWHAAHNLRSSAAAIGACWVSRRCAEIESKASENKLFPSEEVLTALDRELAGATQDLRKLTEVDRRVA
jgi:HPt (histidine-containing phosphotransfer) domain-containing protein